MAHLASILFFLTLLVALATLLDHLVRADLALIAAALRGPQRSQAPAVRVSARPLRALS